tara:strand:+ start:8364 stop:8597 length:234 start_codon:yes stop_codon:yes gene_type:complete
MNKKIFRNSVGWIVLVWNRAEWKFVAVHENGCCKNVPWVDTDEKDKSLAIDTIIDKLTKREFKYQYELQQDLPNATS